MKLKCVFVVFATALAISGCGESPENNLASISGEIVNPRDDYLNISKNGELIDSVFLDENNRFYYEFKNVEKGLYTFRHSYETQMFYLDQGDSLQLHLNTREFDESLMYSGAGSAANNFLMELFLDNQRNNKIFLYYYKYSPEEFVQKTDSISHHHLRELEDLDVKKQFSDDFKKVARNIIDYAFYDLRERYLFLVNKYNQKMKAALPDDFLNYRHCVDFNDKALQTYYIYQHFLTNYLKNRSVEECLPQNTHRNCFNLKSRTNLNRRLALADSLFELKSLRTRFMGRFASETIIYAETKAAVDSTVGFLKQTGYNPEKLKMVEELASVQKSHFMGNIGQRMLLSPSENQVKISSFLDGATVFFYWSVYYTSHQKNSHEKINLLRERYPEINFVGINIDNDDYNLWKTSLDNFGYAQDKEYQLICLPSHEKFYRNYLNKLIFVDENGQVVNGNLQLHDSKLENKLLELLNRGESVVDSR